MQTNSEIKKKSSMLPFSIVGILGAFIVFVVIASLIGFSIVIQNRYAITDGPSQIRSFYIPPTTPMSPTLQPNDRILVDTRPAPVEHGQIIVYMPPPESGVSGVFISRVIGVAGDTVEIYRGNLILNGVPQSEPYISNLATYEMSLVKIPPNSYFVLGDSRNNSNDSHIWGPLPAQNRVGKVILRYWPLNRFYEFDLPPKVNRGNP